MIHRFIAWSLRNRFLVAVATLVLVGLGVRALLRTPVDAIPDLSENQVILVADWAGRSAQEVEDQITYPLTVNLQGLAGVKTVRASSMFGLSMVTVIFHDAIDLYFARQRVMERLNYLAETLPEGVTPRLGPDATGLGWIYQYYLDVDPSRVPVDENGKGHGYDLGTLRALQDWFIRYQLNAVEGVAEVGGIGGFVKTYQIEAASARLRDRGVTLGQLEEALKAANVNVGGKVMEENGQEFVVRGVGLLQGVGEIEEIVVARHGGVPVYLRDVAEVTIGGDFRRGTLDVNGREVVGGIVVMRSGENAWSVIRSVKERVAGIQKSLPPGITIRPFYDRSDLIGRTIDTLRHALVEEVILVTLAHVIFLFHFRSILIVTFPLPASILISFLLMDLFGISSNIMSLSGLVIAIGVLVDAGIVMTENVLRHGEQKQEEVGRPLTAQERMACTLAASQQVGRPIFFSMAIILLSFLPVFALQGQDGKLFHPLAFTKTFALVGSTVLGVSIVPVLCSLLIRGRFRREEEHRVMRGLMRLYEPLLDWSLRHRAAVLVLAALLLLISQLMFWGLPAGWNAKLAAVPGIQRLFKGIPSEPMPKLDEGSLLFMPVLSPATALGEVKRVMAWQDEVFASFPEVELATGKLGRADTATDPAPVEMIETTILLKPKAQWREGMTLERLKDEMSHALMQVPGFVPGGFLQPIENRILMTSTGIRAQLGVKIFGDDLQALQQKAYEVERIVSSVPGASGVAVSRVVGKPYLEVMPRRETIARYGLSVREVLEVVETGIGGREVGTLIDGRERYPIQLRLEAGERDDLRRVGDLLVPITGDDGVAGAVPLGQLADIRRVVGPSEIASENGRLRVFVQANVAGRDLSAFVKEVKVRIEHEIVPTLAPGMTIGYSGEYENQIAFMKTMQWVIPMALAIIFVLLFSVYGSAKEAAHVILAVPFALSGSVFLQYLLGFPFTAAVAVGYLALFGMAIQTGVVMVVYLEEMLEQRRAERGRPLDEEEIIAAVKDGARLRLRPKVMTVATTLASLLPVFWLDRTGNEVMQPLATPVVGGCLSSLVHILLVTPVIFAWLRTRELKKSGPSARTEREVLHAG
ncbi:MAG TPA: CusA/CzcA family heavy metal efflux RND transporter [Chthoniobacteraceae bacterium]|nr:CusA/CzcA family heavy metal efflux RND transporter [Chthoniobacteraceae bacterium]